MMTLKSAVILMYFVVVIVTPTPIDSEVDTIILEENEIISEQAPWHVSIRFNGIHFCSGAIISSDWVITSAQCIFDCKSINQMITIRTGKGTIHKLLSYVIHKDFKLVDECNVPKDDIGLLQIIDTFDSYGHKPIPTIDISGLIDDLSPDTKVNVTHWNQEFANSKFSDTLKMSRWLAISDQQCLSYYYSMNSIHDSRFCAINNDNNVPNPCLAGDLGDPLVFDGQLIGIKSWKMNCTVMSQSPTIFTKVRPYSNWIMEITDPYYVADDDYV